MKHRVKQGVGNHVRSTPGASKGEDSKTVIFRSGDQIELTELEASSFPDKFEPVIGAKSPTK